ncbi:MAG: hypothetical protein KatS3mg110_2479 [Pirellulaceae bacterium]|nr:MAG: hypothetical protein KatS3mg110_2479 [Pirellulaceae bacterium]
MSCCTVRRLVWLVVGTALLPLVVLGTACNQQRAKAPKPVPVSGTVYLDGKPVAGVVVRFNSPHFQGEGKTDANGHYELMQGATPGENIVTFHQDVQGLNPEEGLDLGQLEAAGGDLPGVKVPTGVIPAGYADSTKNPIKYVVPPEGTDSADFRLSSSGP